ncbi:MAG: hypothetical protein R3A45_02300 [Bdellovibrionota bacterium]
MPQPPQVTQPSRPKPTTKDENEELRQEIETWIKDDIVPKVSKAIYLPYDGSIPIKVELTNVSEQLAYMEEYYRQEDPENPGKTYANRNDWIGEYVTVLGLLQDANDFLPVYKDFRSSFAAASYYNGTIEVYLEPDQPLDKDRLYSSLVHEVVHLLQDQYFPFRHPDVYQDNEYEAHKGLIEGHAKFIDLLFRNEINPDDVTNPEFSKRFKKYLEDYRVQLESYNISNDPSATQKQLQHPELSNFLLYDAVTPYSYGPLIVSYIIEDLVEQGIVNPAVFWKKVHAFLDNQPVSMEQVLHPEKMAAFAETADAPDPVKEDALEINSEETLVETTIFGENTWRSLLRAYGIDTAEAVAAAAGWDGDRVWVLRNNDGVHSVHMLIRFDSDQDLQEFVTTLKKAIDGKSILHVEVDALELRLVFTAKATQINS